MIKRYRPDINYDCPDMVECSVGDWVSLDDYQDALDEIARLQGYCGTLESAGADAVSRLDRCERLLTALKNTFGPDVSKLLVIDYLHAALSPIGCHSELHKEGEPACADCAQTI